MRLKVTKDLSDEILERLSAARSIAVLLGHTMPEISEWKLTVNKNEICGGCVKCGRLACVDIFTKKIGGDAHNSTKKCQTFLEESCKR